MLTFLYLAWRFLKNMIKLVFWLILLGAFFVFIVWFLSKIHPVFDIGIDHWLLKIWDSLKNFALNF
jgi:hypothetical protein